jgi:hypothetical protein
VRLGPAINRQAFYGGLRTDPMTRATTTSSAIGFTFVRSMGEFFI